MWTAWIFSSSNTHVALLYLGWTCHGLLVLSLHKRLLLLSSSSYLVQVKNSLLLNMADQNRTLYSAEVMLMVCMMTLILPYLDWKYPLMIQRRSVCLFLNFPVPDHINDSQLSCDRVRLIFPLSIF